jgi:hypothetical protein
LQRIKIVLFYLPEGVAAYVAQVPPVNQAPRLIKQPVCEPPVVAIRYPVPDSVPGTPVLVGVGPVLSVVVGGGGGGGGGGVVGVGVGVGAGLPDFGGYRIPDAGHVDFVPSISGQES